MAPPVRTLYLARHGRTPWNVEGRWQGSTDVPLDETGRRQAVTMAARVAALGISRVTSSDLVRARETAEIIARHLTLPAPMLEPDLRERVFGVFEGLTRDECVKQHPEHWARYEASRVPPPGAEAFEAVMDRMVAAARRMADAIGPGAAALAVTHGGSIRALVVRITGTLPPPVRNGALWRVQVTAGGFGDVDELEPAADV